MKLAVESFTNPIDPTEIMARVDKSNASGGGGGGGGGSVVALYPVGDMLTDMVQADNYPTGVGENVVATMQMNLIGGRKLVLMGTLSGFGDSGFGPAPVYNSHLFFRVNGDVVVGADLNFTDRSGAVTLPAVKSLTTGGVATIDLVLSNNVAFVNNNYSAYLMALEFAVAV